MVRGTPRIGRGSQARDQRELAPSARRAAMNLDDVASADDVLEAARFLLGDTFAPPEGIVQTCAIDSGNRVIRIGEHSPKSAWDFFVLHLARASADAIVTTGKILR